MAGYVAALSPACFPAAAARPPDPFPFSLASRSIHIAEAKGIPYFRAFTMPWTRTHDYPHASVPPPAARLHRLLGTRLTPAWPAPSPFRRFMVPQFEMSAQFNYATYVLFDNLMWKATAGQVNRWRRKELDLPPTVSPCSRSPARPVRADPATSVPSQDMSHLKAGQVPFVYNFSSAVVPKPLDWKDQMCVSRPRRGLVLGG